MSGTRPGQGRRGVPAGDAARLLGLNYEAVRKRIKRGTLPAYKEGNRWYVLLDAVPDTPPDIVPDTIPDKGGTPVPDSPEQTRSRPVDETRVSSVTPAEVERAIEATAARYVADFAGLYDRISTEVAARYEQTIAAKDETIAELRRRAEAAEAERDELRTEVHDMLTLAASAPLSEATTPSVSADTPAPLAPAGGFWQRVRRAFGGE